MAHLGKRGDSRSLWIFNVEFDTGVPSLHGTPCRHDPAMGFNKRKMEDRRREAEKEGRPPDPRGRRAAGDRLNERQAKPRSPRRSSH